MQTEAYELASTQRKKIETLFGEVNRIPALTRLRLRGLTGARDEFLLAATVQNLNRLARHSTIPPTAADRRLNHASARQHHGPTKPNRLSITLRRRETLRSY